MKDTPRKFDIIQEETTTPRGKPIQICSYECAFHHWGETEDQHCILGFSKAEEIKPNGQVATLKKVVTKPGSLSKWEWRMVPDEKCLGDGTYKLVEEIE